MTRTSNTYNQGRPLSPTIHGIGRPVTLFTPSGHVVAGIITRIADSDRAALRYDVQVIDGGKYRDLQLGTLNNPQPNTFVFAP